MNLRLLSIDFLLKPQHSFKNVEDYAKYILGNDFITSPEYKSFLTVYYGLVALEYISVDADGIKLTPKGSSINKNNGSRLLATVPWIIPSKEKTNWNRAFYNLMEVERKPVSSPQRVKVLINDNIPRIKSVIDSLNDKQKYNFYVSLQDQMEQEALKGIENK